MALFAMVSYEFGRCRTCRRRVLTRLDKGERIGQLGTEHVTLWQQLKAVLLDNLCEPFRLLGSASTYPFIYHSLHCTAAYCNKCLSCVVSIWF